MCWGEWTGCMRMWYASLLWAGAGDGGGNPPPPPASPGAGGARRRRRNGRRRPAKPCKRAGRKPGRAGAREAAMSERPHVPAWLRERVYRLAHGRWQRCGVPITLDDMHVAHKRAHAHGGPLIPENLEAWCVPCNLTVGATDVADDRGAPRPGQQGPLEPVVQRIVDSGVATVSAAPGAGKTIFASLVFERLLALGAAERVAAPAPA